MDDDEIRRVAETIVWDYNYSSDDIADVLRGCRARIGHLDRSALFTRMLQTLPWQRIVATLTIEETKMLLTAEAINRLWPHSLRERYERIRRLLRGDHVPPAEWSPENALRLRTGGDRSGVQFLNPTHDRIDDIPLIYFTPAGANRHSLVIYQVPPDGSALP